MANFLSFKRRFVFYDPAFFLRPMAVKITVSVPKAACPGLHQAFLSHARQFPRILYIPIPGLSIGNPGKSVKRYLKPLPFPGGRGRLPCVKGAVSPRLTEGSPCCRLGPPHTRQGLRPCHPLPGEGRSPHPSRLAASHLPRRGRLPPAGKAASGGEGCLRRGLVILAICTIGCAKKGECLSPSAFCLIIPQLRPGFKAIYHKDVR